MKSPTVIEPAARWSAGLALLAAISTCLTGCLVPPAASMQSARCMDEGQYRIAPYASAVEQTESVASPRFDQSQVANDYGCLLGFGASHSHEFQIRFDRFHFPDGGDGYNFTSIGPKFGVVDNVLAILVPIGIYWDWGAFALDTVELHPGAILSIPVSTHLEINTAGKLILPLSHDAPSWSVANLGLSLSSDVDHWALMPEVGFAWPLDDLSGGLFVTYGVAIAFYPRSGE